MRDPLQVQASLRKTGKRKVAVAKRKTFLSALIDCAASARDLFSFRLVSSPDAATMGQGNLENSTYSQSRDYWVSTTYGLGGR